MQSMNPNPDSLVEQAFALALQARGTTLPNPAVGCIVLDKSGKVVGKAATSASGRPHAERQALEQAGPRARGGTVVVTLEPCVAFPGKKSPPCAAAVLLSGAETLVVGSPDPNPQVSGRGLHALRKAGLKVIEAPLGGRIPDFYAGFGHFLSTGRPRVTLKIAVSADGFCAAGAGARTDITGPEARAFVHSLRAASDAVLVGGSTARIDDPELTVRDAPGRSPRRMVLWPSGGLDAGLKLWTGPVPSVAWGAGSRPTALPATAGWEPVPQDGTQANLQALVVRCGELGLHDLLVEPGPKLLQSFLRTGAWDRLWVVRSPDALGNGVPFDPSGLLPKSAASRSVKLGKDLAEEWEREPNPAPRAA
jgi:diaminohydroxyphosphoribosylaminopyrimidine deaminase/5-amino-6-(5-phosphoribosylamino)uracil reductase